MTGPSARPRCVGFNAPDPCPDPSPCSCFVLAAVAAGLAMLLQSRFWKSPDQTPTLRFESQLGERVAAQRDQKQEIFKSRHSWALRGQRRPGWPSSKTTSVAQAGR